MIYVTSATDQGTQLIVRAMAVPETLAIPGSDAKTVYMLLWEEEEEEEEGEQGEINVLTAHQHQKSRIMPNQVNAR